MDTFSVSDMKKLLQPRKPGLMIRLTHLILIQVLFIFGALALVLFYPPSHGGPGELNSDPTPALQAARQRIVQHVESAARTSPGRKSLDAVLADAFRTESAILYVRGHLICPNRDDQPLPFTYRKDGFSAAPELVETAAHLSDGGGRNPTAGEDVDQAFPRRFNRDYVVYTYSFDINETDRAEFVVFWDHGLLLSSKSGLIYALFLLFLGVTLTALLTVYLVARRFTNPYRRLQHALERTATGELYYLLETGGEREVAQMAEAFNKLSEALRTDHTKLKQFTENLEEANMHLRQSQSMLATIIDSSPIGVITTDLNSRIMVFNKKAAEFFGYTAADVVGESIDMLFTSSLEIPARDGEPATGPFETEILGRRRDGSLFPAYVAVSPVTTAEGTDVAHVCLVRDISESKSFQEMLIRLDRYYTRGQMTGDIAHEINNYLSVLLGNVELLPLLLKNGKQDKALDKLEVMRQTIDRIAGFSDGLMDSNPDEVHFEKADLNQIVENVLAFLKPQNRFDGVDIRTCLSTEIDMVPVDSALMQQVLVDLVYNAADALKEGNPDKRITITTDTIELEDRRAVQICIADNGPGVLADRVDCLFTKRFTTKRKGHGIGLITCRRILDQHQGQITYRYEDGAVFTVILPVGQDIGTMSIPDKSEADIEITI